MNAGENHSARPEAENPEYRMGASANAGQSLDDTKIASALEAPESRMRRALPWLIATPITLVAMGCTYPQELNAAVQNILDKLGL